MNVPDRSSFRRAAQRLILGFEYAIGRFTVSYSLQFFNYALLVSGVAYLSAVVIYWGGDVSEKSAQLFLAIESVLFGMVTVLGLIQVIWLRRRIEFSEFSKNMFIAELYQVLASVQPLRTGSDNRPAGDDADFYFLCNVHDPCLSELSGHPTYSLFVREFYRVMNDTKVIKKIAISAPEADLFERHGVTLGPATLDELREVGSLLNMEQHYIRWTTRLQQDDPKFTFGQWWPPDKVTELEDIMRPLERADRSADESGAFHRYKECVALFRELFTVNREPGDTSIDLFLYGLKYPKLDIWKRPEQTTSINLFCSRTRGLLIFFDFFSYPHYTIEAMPLHNTKFLRELIVLFREKTRDSVEIHLRKKPDAGPLPAPRA